MIVEAINKRTGEPVRIGDARYGQRFACPYCSADMHPVLKVPKPFFRCNEGEIHKHYLCAQLDGPTNKVYDPMLTNIEELFANLFNPVREKKEPSWGPKDDEDPGVLDPEDETIDGDEHTQAPEDGTDDEDEDKDKGEATSGPVIVPCKTLSQLWKAGIHKFGPSERIGSHLRSDIFLWFKDFDRFFTGHKSLGERVIAVKPCWRADQVNAIVFLSHSKIPGSEKRKRKFFVLEFQKRKEYNAACKKLFFRKPNKNGTEKPAPMYDMVLVAGDWAELDEKESAIFVKPGENNYGVQRSTFFSKNQIYAIPEYKIKK